MIRVQKYWHNLDTRLMAKKTIQMFYIAYLDSNEYGVISREHMTYFLVHSLAVAS